MNDDGARYDSGFDGNGPFRDTPEAGGISLESALHDFGPAAIDDLIPRITALAAALDAAHAAGAIHGALHPSKVIITGETTSLVRGTRASRPYIAPEMADGEAPSPASDQFALAAIAYEWLFGRPIDRPAERPVEVRNMPGVERAALSKAFTRALAPRPSDRFASCAAFCDALSASVVPELPFDSERESAFLAQDWPLLVEDRADEEFEPAEPSIPEEPVLNVDDVKKAAATPVESSGSQRFGGFALIVATLVGAVFGFAAGYMARPRALQSGPPQTIATPPAGTDQSIPAPVTPTPIEEPEIRTTPTRRTPAPAAKTAESRPQTRPRPQPAVGRPEVSTGSLAVDSRPVGASVTINGRVRGRTPLLLTAIAPGEYRVQLSMAGYRSFATTVRVVAGERVRAAASLTAQEQE